jgi:hypothetical protein
MDRSGFRNAYSEPIIIRFFLVLGCTLTGRASSDCAPTTIVAFVLCRAPASVVFF